VTERVCVCTLRKFMAFNCMADFSAVFFFVWHFLSGFLGFGLGSVQIFFRYGSVRLKQISVRFGSAQKNFGTVRFGSIILRVRFGTGSGGVRYGFGSKLGPERGNVEPARERGKPGTEAAATRTCEPI